MKGISLAVLLLAGNVWASNNNNDKIEMVAHPTQVMVKFKSSDVKSLKNFSNIKSEELTEKVSLFHLPMALNSEKIVNDFKNDPNIEWIEPNMMVIGDAREFEPNDPHFAKQFHHQLIETPAAWDNLSEGEEVVVAVTDDGFDLVHEDLMDTYYRNPNEIPDNGIDDDQNGFIDDSIGWNFNNNNNNPGSDTRNGAHGTHVAGIVSGGFNNGVGITGMGPNIKTMPIKFYGSESWTADIVLRSYKYAADNGAKIITTSYYIDGFANNNTYKEALKYADEKGLLVFNSAGNGSARQSARTKLQRIILVCSVQSAANQAKWDIKSRFSNYGKGVDVCAPGDPVYSAGRNNRYVNMSGTSMASPNAAALAALIWSQNPNFNKEQVLAQLMMSGNDIDSKNSRYKKELGNGRINANRAIALERRPLSFKSVSMNYVDKIVSLQLQGILDSGSVTRGGIIVEDRAGNALEDITIESINKYYMGTNILKYRINAPVGEYTLRVKARSFIDPFGQELDGDRNGQSGGDFTWDFAIED